MTKLLLIGPPGAGKGSQAAILGPRFGVRTISTGDVFRWNIERETPLGLQVKEIVGRGELVSDDLTTELVKDRLASTPGGWILDGYPRNVEQARRLESMLDEFGRGSLSAAIYLSTDADRVIERIEKRAAAEHRADDAKETVLARLRVYQEQVAPLLDFYRTRSLLVEVDGNLSVSEVTEQIMSHPSRSGASY